MTILRAQVESNERGLCHCGQRATSELSYAKEMDQRQDASSPSPPSSPPTNGSYQTPVVSESAPPVPEDVQLPSPTSSKEVSILVPPPRAATPGREVSGQCCWTLHKIDPTPGSGASHQLFWRSSGLQGKDRTRPYPIGRGEARGSAGDWRLQAEQLLGPSELGPSPPGRLHVLFRGASSRALLYGWKSVSPSRPSRD